MAADSLSIAALLCGLHFRPRQDGQHPALSAVTPHGHDDLGVFCERVRERHPVCLIEPNQCAGAAASYGYHPRYQKYR